MVTEAILFDFDGVLVDSEKLKVQSHKLSLGKYGVTDGDKFYRRNQGIEGERISVLAVQEFGLEINPLVLFKEREEIYERLIKNGLPTIGSSIKFLKKVVKSTDFKTGLVTSVYPEPLERYLNFLCLKDYFDSITTVKEVCRGKDNPDIYIFAAGKLNIPLCKCAVIEDSKIGVSSAKQAGMYSIGFRPKGNPEYFEGAADLVIDDLNKIDLRALKNLRR